MLTCSGSGMRGACLAFVLLAGVGCRGAPRPDAPRPGLGRRAAAATIERGLVDAVEASRERALAFVRAHQRPDGTWYAPCPSDASLAAWHVLFERYLGRTDAGLERRLVAHLLETQGPDGAWHVAPGGAASVDVSVSAYAALKAAGRPVDDPALTRARHAIARLGGIERTYPTTRLLPALLGQVPLRVIPYAPVEMVCASAGARPNLHDLSFTRVATPATGLLLRHRAVRPLPPGRGIGEIVPHPERLRIAPDRPRDLASELRLGVASIVLTSLRVRDRLRAWGAADEEALRWIRRRQEADGSWAGAFFATVVNAMALDALGDSSGDRARVDRGLEALRGWLADDGRTAWPQVMLPTALQTALGVLALTASGHGADRAAVDRALAWLVAHQARGPGDWVRQAVPGTPAGGWSFGGTSARYPDTDTTAIVLCAMQPYRDRHPDAYRRGVDWLLGMQGRGGGWAAWSRDARPYPLLPMEEVSPGTSDPPDADITARVLELLGPEAADGAVDDAAFAAIERGLAFLRRERHPEGSWEAHWTVARAPGTAYVLLALDRTGRGLDLVPPSVAFLERIQNADGGWGESRESHRARRFVGGPSNAYVTGMVLRALLACGRERTPAVQRGIRWLLDAQRDDGAWEDTAWSGVVLPGRQYVQYPFVPTTTVLQAFRAALIAWEGGRGEPR